MRIRYSKSVRARTFGNVPCHFETDQAVTWLPREACVMAGFTCEELNTAEKFPNTWIDCPREEATNPACERCTELTKQRKALLEACVKMRSIFDACVIHSTGEYRIPIPLLQEHMQVLHAAIALAEPETPC